MTVPSISRLDQGLATRPIIAECHCPIWLGLDEYSISRVCFFLCSLCNLLGDSAESGSCITAAHNGQFLILEVSEHTHRHTDTHTHAHVHTHTHTHIYTHTMYTHTHTLTYTHTHTHTLTYTHTHSVRVINLQL